MDVSKGKGGNCPSGENINKIFKITDGKIMF